jgi:uncharacterized protein
MPYLIDGHNLIPHLGLHLSSLDDEMQLLARLQRFCRLRRTRVDVYFDGAPPGQPVTRKAGLVTAHFIRQGSSADAALENRLGNMKNTARNWTVVSSDRRVQRAAKAARAGVLPADQFARDMRHAEAEGSPQGAGETDLSPGELEEWLKTFGPPSE